MRLPDIIDCLNECLDVDQPAIIWGKPGIGKSQAIAQLAARRGARLIDVRLSDMESIDLRGIPAREGNRTIWLRPDFLPTENDGEIIIFFDEMDRPSSPSVLNPALQLILDRRVGGHTLPDNVRILAAGNGSTDKGTIRFTHALNNRFAHYFVEYDAAALRAHFAAIGAPVELIGFLHLRPEMGLTVPPNGEFAGEYAAASPRQWERVARFQNSPRRFAHARALVGSIAAQEYEAFCGMFSKLPPIGDILANPTGAPVPTFDSSLFYALSMALARLADRSNIAAVYTYLKRLPRDYEIAGMLTATARDESLMKTAAYIEYAARNQDVTA